MDGMRGQVALVTGASRGIGRATAERLATEGVRIVLNYSAAADREHGEAAAEEAAAAVRDRGGDVLMYEADVSDRAAVQAMVAVALARFGRIDIAVNNAGIGHRDDITTLPEEVWDRVLDVDLKSQYLVAQAVVPGMMERRGGRIINIASELALIGSAERVAYCAAKAGVIGLTKALARELAPYNILVNAVAPGPVDTDLLGPSGRSEEYVSTIPLQRIGRPAEMASAICFLASPESSWTTGQVFSPNGGTVI